MIKLKDLISENNGRTESIPKPRFEELVASSFGESYQAELSTKTALYRALRSNYGDFGYINPSQTERRSRDTNNFYTALISILPSWEGYPKRTHSVIALVANSLFEKSTFNTINEYGKNIYTVYPQNGAKFSVASTEDAFDAFGTIHRRFGLTSLDTYNTWITVLFNSYSKSIGKSYYETYDTENISKTLSEWDEIKIENFIEFLKQYQTSSQFPKRFAEDLRLTFTGNWLSYFDDVLSAKKTILNCWI